MVTLRSCFPMLPHCLPAGNSGQQQLCHGAHASNSFPMALRHGAPASNIFPIALRCSAPASNSSVTAPPASNKPHLAEKSTPVWLAIWRTWAGFANSQLMRAAFRSTY